MLLALPACAHLSKDADRSHASPSLAASLMEIYQRPLNHLRAVRAGECPMTPSCSEYCRQAMEKHGFFLGWLMSVDRLLRCGRDELKIAPQIFVDGKRKAYDPVENNDFWWDPPPLIKRHTSIGLRRDGP
jgi:putative component of membrane protein insertase Oxa1/YidC/SpoIIIJ protein YidD